MCLGSPTERKLKVENAQLQVQSFSQERQNPHNRELDLDTKAREQSQRSFKTA